MRNALSTADHPRIRGEHVPASFVSSSGNGSSPHTRGAPVRGEHERYVVRIIPAYAGSTHQLTCWLSARPDHPRIRGEHRDDMVGDETGDGSSPHTRGAPRQRTAPAERERIIPAYAGSTRSREQTQARGADHPRIRGEHLPSVSQSPTFRGSSPHTRGALPRDFQGDRRGRIIPAYAGSTAAVSILVSPQ